MDEWDITESKKIKARKKLVLALLQQCKDSGLSVSEVKRALSTAIGEIDWKLNSLPVESVYRLHSSQTDTQQTEDT